ncbi:MAG TPA: DUF2059 domain-containing protein [Rhizomicrobium sp.]|jgi:hypothetical protein|nr:DUF2059 domain-containing protein [Rhizomicrobium sp.]
MKAGWLLSVPFVLLAALRPSFAQTTEQLLAQPPERLAALRNDPHIQKAMKFLDVSDSRADVLAKTDLLVDRVVMEETHQHPGQTAQFWDGFRANVKSQIQTEVQDFLVLSAELYASRFSDAELDQLIAFYSSGIGAKYFRVREQLDRQELELASAWSKELAPKVVEEVHAKMSGKKPTP